MEKSTKQMIVKLIYMDIVNHKLMSGLLDIQVDAEPYYLSIDEVIFEMLGLTDIPNEDAIYEEYLLRLSEVKQLNLKLQREKVELLAEELLDLLMSKKI